MIDSLRNFFELNATVIFFLYGQVFFVLGLAIALQSRKHSRLELARILGWLAAFGITHGLHEWGLVFIPIQATYVGQPAIALLRILQVVLLTLSFVFLFQFGAEMLRDRWPRLRMVPLLVVVGWGLLFIMPGLALGPDLEEWHRQASIWSRYLIGAPAALLAAVGLRYQAKRYIKPLGLLHIYRTLRVAGFALGAYAVFGGLVVPEGNFFPANWLNDARLLELFGIPVAVFRSLIGTILLVAMIRALEVFDVEIDRLIEDVQVEHSLMAERERIGRELHDGTIQSVYTAGLLVESTRQKLDADSPAGQHLDRAMAILNGAITNLRAYIEELRPGILEQTLADGLREQAADPRFTSLMKVELDLDFAAETILSPVRTAHVLAIVGEALSNVAWHAHARRVTVRAARVNGQLSIMIEDDGQGFDSDPHRTGYGLRNMRDRARLLGGRLKLDSRHGHGTRVTLLAPWEDE